MRILVLERALASAIVFGARKFANLWLLPSASMVGARIGIAGESEDDGFWFWFYRHRLGLQFDLLPAGIMGSVVVERVAPPGELGSTAFGPAVWVFSGAKRDRPTGKAFRAGYEAQPHVQERDRLRLGQAQKAEGK